MQIRTLYGDVGLRIDRGTQHGHTVTFRNHVSIVIQVILLERLLRRESRIRGLKEEKKEIILSH